MSNSEVIKAKKIVLTFLILMIPAMIFINKNKMNISTNNSKTDSDFYEEIQLEKEIIDGMIISDKIYFNTEDKIYCYNIEGEKIWGKDINVGNEVLYGFNAIYISNGKDVVERIDQEGKIKWSYKDEFKDVFLLDKYIAVYKEDNNELELINSWGKVDSKIENVQGELISVNSDANKRIILNTLETKDDRLMSRITYHSIYGDKLSEIEIMDTIIQKVYMDKESAILICDDRFLILDNDKIKYEKEIESQIISHEFETKEKNIYLIKSGESNEILRINLKSKEVIDKEVNCNNIIFTNNKVTTYSNNLLQILDKDLKIKEEFSFNRDINKILTYENGLIIIGENYINITKEE